MEPNPLDATASSTAAGGEVMPWHSPETDVILESMPRKQKRKKLIYNVAVNNG